MPCTYTIKLSAIYVLRFLREPLSIFKQDHASVVKDVKDNDVRKLWGTDGRNEWWEIRFEKEKITFNKNMRIML